MTDVSRVADKPPAAAGTAGERSEVASGLIRGTIGELERMLGAESVVGEPMTFGDVTVVPLLSVGFGFGAGAGGGGGHSPKGDQGQGSGAGGVGGGGVKAIAVLVIDQNGARLEPIPEAPTGLDKLGSAIADALDRRGARNSGEND